MSVDKDEVTLYLGTKPKVRATGQPCVGSVRDSSGQKWFLLLIKDANGGEHELLRSVYLHSVFDVLFHKEIEKIIPDALKKPIGKVISKELEQQIFADTRLDLQDQMAAEEAILMKVFDQKVRNYGEVTQEA